MTEIKVGSGGIIVGVIIGFILTSMVIVSPAQNLRETQVIEALNDSSIANWKICYDDSETRHLFTDFERTYQYDGYIVIATYNLKNKIIYIEIFHDEQERLK